MGGNSEAIRCDKAYPSGVTIISHDYIHILTLHDVIGDIICSARHPS